MNALQFESSPYLQQHKDQPVNWYPWNKSILEKAKSENKLILISIGYSTCHWCHVMAHESFENNAIAAMMNQHFINIKIDREERPDLDQYFMHAVQQMGVQGGWPLNVFLTPDGKVFYGGTYFPPVKKYGRISWPELIQYISSHFEENPNEIITQANAFEKELNHRKTSQITNESSLINAFDFQKVEDQIYKYIDQENGGFGFAPKFPQSIILDYILKSNHYADSNHLKQHANFSVKKMCFSGLFDHVGGGYYRYCVDSIWAIPHFEKMLYDQALILQNLALIVRQENEKQWSQLFIDKTIHFLNREMYDAQTGLYYAAINADSEGEEGKFYVWDESLFEDYIGYDQKPYADLFELHPVEMGNGKHLVPHWQKFTMQADLVNTYLNCNVLFQKLYEVRKDRIRPSTDQKQILSWNALLLMSYCTLFESTFDTSYKEAAIQLMENIQTHFILNKQEKVYCRYVIHNTKQGIAFFEDYVYLAHALLRLYSCTLDKKYLQEAKDLVKFSENYFSNMDGLFQMTGKLHVDSLNALPEWEDSSLINANAMFCEINRILYLIYSEEHYSLTMEHLLNRIPSRLINYPLAYGSWLSIIEEYKNGGLLIKCHDQNQREYFLKTYAQRQLQFHLKETGAIDEVEICEGSQCRIQKL